VSAEITWFAKGAVSIEDRVTIKVSVSVEVTFVCREYCT
jgi:hypothetical protein